MVDIDDIKFEQWSNKIEYSDHVKKYIGYVDLIISNRTIFDNVSDYTEYISKMFNIPINDICYVSVFAGWQYNKSFIIMRIKIKESTKHCVASLKLAYG